MSPSIAFISWLRERGFTFYTGVPDSVLRGFCAELELHKEIRHVPAANEGAAVGMGIGWYLASGEIPVIYLQNSGLWNALNPYFTLAHPEVYSIPLLFIVGWRGRPGFVDEPQHRSSGNQTEFVLKMMGISPLIIEKWDTGTANQADQYLEECRRMGRAAALLISAGVFDDRLPSSLGEGQNQYPSRAKIIDTILNYVAPKDFVIAGIGHTGRQLYGSRLKREATNDELLQDFLCVGGMGYALQVAIGAGLRHTNGRIWCIEGDGSFLMHLGTAATIRQLGDFALICILLDNGAHASVGGQRTASVSLDYAAAADALGFRSTEKVSSVGELNTAIPKLLERVGPHFLWSKIANEPDIVLPRPNESFGDRKSAVMKLLRG